MKEFSLLRWKEAEEYAAFLANEAGEAACVSLTTDKYCVEKLAAFQPAAGVDLTFVAWPDLPSMVVVNSHPGFNAAKRRHENE